MRLSPSGAAAVQWWDEIPKHFPHAALDAVQVMPNHVHGVLLLTRPGQPSALTGQVGDRLRGTSMTVGSVVRGFKIGVTKWLRQHTAVHDVWHRNYWEHIVRNEAELGRIRRYIRNNPLQWELDRMSAARDIRYGRGPDDWQPPRSPRCPTRRVRPSDRRSDPRP